MSTGTSRCPQVSSSAASGARPVAAAAGGVIGHPSASPPDRSASRRSRAGLTILSLPRTGRRSGLRAARASARACCFPRLPGHKTGNCGAWALMSIADRQDCRQWNGEAREHGLWVRTGGRDVQDTAMQRPLPLACRFCLHIDEGTCGVLAEIAAVGLSLSQLQALR